MIQPAVEPDDDPAKIEDTGLPCALLTVCLACADTTESGEDGLGGGASLHTILERLHDAHPFRHRVEIRTQRCLMACSNGCVASVSAPGKMQYLLGRMPAEPALAEQLLDFAVLYDDAETGIVANHRWPPRIGLHFLGRIPPADPVDADWRDDGCDL